MNFETELKALFEKYDVRFDVRNSYTVEFVAGDKMNNVVYLSVSDEGIDDETGWTRASDVFVTYNKG